MEVVKLSLDGEPSRTNRRVVSEADVIDFRKTLRGLSDLDEKTPILLEERYLNVQDGLGLLLRLRMETSMGASRCPVFVRLHNDLEKHLRRDAKFIVLCTEGVRLLQNGDEPTEEDKPSSLTKTADRDPLLDVLRRLPIRSVSDGSRHDLANRWGPLRLWAGLQTLQSKEEVQPNPAWVTQLNEQLRDEEPYAYLLALASLREAQQEAHPQEEKDAYKEWKAFLRRHRGTGLRVLLLDDEIAQGWGDAVKAALNSPGTIEVDTSLAAADFERTQSLADKVVDDAWDLVLADLRTTTRDRAKDVQRGADHFSGADLIARIKRDHPETAIVAFTASNKAWSVEELRQLGIDGYWIKESPEYGVDPGYSASNVASLLTNVRSALEPRIEARPIWDLKRDLDHLISGGDFVEQWAHTMMRPKLNFAFRLNAVTQRLARAYGFMIMKRSVHEEEEFAMRNYDLALLTLWSIINEVVELYFDDPRKDPSFSFTGPLHKVWDAEFSIRNPTTKQRLVYWHLKNRHEVISPNDVPKDLVDALCPGSSRDANSNEPRWPWGRSETAGITWLLRLAGKSDLARRFDEPKYGGRPGLRELRNKLEYEHGRHGDLQEADIDDIHAMCEVWRALLITPYA